MTVNTSPRLGLMLPTNADVFDPNDFVNTFNILDGKPGLTIVANYASLPSGWTTTQHGSECIQMDNLAKWVWYMPSSGTPGVWKRTNSSGVLGQGSMPSYTSTTATTIGAAPTLGTVTVVAPGGRMLMIFVEYGAILNTLGEFDVAAFVNGTEVQLAQVNHPTAATGDNAVLVGYYTPTVGQSCTATFTMWAPIGGNTACAGAGIQVVEV